MRQIALLLLAVLGLAAAGCDSGDDGSADRPSAPREVTTTRVKVVEGVGSKGGFNPAQIYDRLAPGVVTILSVFDGGGSLLDAGGEAVTTWPSRLRPQPFPVRAGFSRGIPANNLGEALAEPGRSVGAS